MYDCDDRRREGKVRKSERECVCVREREREKEREREIERVRDRERWGGGGEVGRGLGQIDAKMIQCRIKWIEMFRLKKISTTEVRTLLFIILFCFIVQ